MWDSIGTKIFVNFCCRRIDFRLPKIRCFFSSIFRNTKIDFSANQKICKNFVRLETLARFHVSESRPGGAVRFRNIFAPSTNPQENVFLQISMNCDVYFSLHRHFFSGFFAKNPEIDIMKIHENLVKIAWKCDFAKVGTRVEQNKRHRPPASGEHGVFPLAKSTLPLGETMFPLAKSTFPLGETMFPLAETVFPTRFSKHVCPGPGRFLVFGTCLFGARTTCGRVALILRYKIREIFVQIFVKKAVMQKWVPPREK